MKYIDAFVIPLSKKNIDAYIKMSKIAGKIWKEYGALEYRECISEDIKNKMEMPFPKLLNLKTGEVAVFSWIVYKSKTHRNSVNAKVMKDPRLAKMMDPKAMPFDPKRMTYGGFDMMLDL